MYCDCVPPPPPPLSPDEEKYLRPIEPFYIQQKEREKREEELKKLEFRGQFSDNFKQQLNKLGNCANKQLKISLQKYENALNDKQELINIIKDFQTDDIYDEDEYSEGKGYSFDNFKKQLLRSSEKCQKLKLKCEFYENMCEFLKKCLYE